MSKDLFPRNGNLNDLLVYFLFDLGMQNYVKEKKNNRYKIMSITELKEQHHRLSERQPN